MQLGGLGRMTLVGAAIYPPHSYIESSFVHPEFGPTILDNDASSRAFQGFMVGDVRRRPFSLCGPYLTQRVQVPSTSGLPTYPASEVADPKSS